MANLKFGVATSNDGFTSFGTAAFNDLPPARIVRELIQNSLDAAVEGAETTAKVRFKVDTLRKEDVPDLEGFVDAFNKAVDHQTMIGDGVLPDAAEEVVSRIQRGLNSIDEGEGKLLVVVDNGVGLDKKRMNSLLADGASGKPNSASGSYGVGHLAPIALSDIRYMLYGGVTRDGHRIVCGKTILAPHPGEKSLNDAKGFLVDGFANGLDGNLYYFLESKAHPKLVTRHLDALLEEHGHGCAVLIPAFNNFRSGGMSLWDIVSKVVAYNFAPAIHQGKLVIEVVETGDPVLLDDTSMASILEQEQDRVRAARSDSFFVGLRPSGQYAYSILRAITASESQVVLVNGDAVRVNLLLPSSSGVSRIDLFRNGMWITDSIPGLRQADFANRQPFHAVITVDANDGGETHRLIRKAEGPMHDKLSTALLSSLEQDTLRQVFSNIADWINGQVPPLGTEEFTVNDFLLVNTGDDDTGGSKSFSFWGDPVAMSSRTVNQVPAMRPSPGPGPGPGPGPNPGPGPGPDPGPGPAPGPGPVPSPDPVRQRRPAHPLPFRSAVIREGGDKLVGSVTSASDIPEAWLTLRVDENVDPTCDRIWQDEDLFLKVFQISPAESDGPPLESAIVRGGQFVKIMGIKAGTKYEVEAEYDIPTELGSVVQRPVIRLEIYRPPTVQGSRQGATG